jgi:NADH-quinone oxidoreductase subunit L
LPIVGALLTPLFAKISHKVRDYGAVIVSLLAAISALSMIPDFLAGTRVDVQVALPWVMLPSETEPLKAGVLVDPLSILMVVIVTSISFLIMVYSLGYMHGDPCLTRYWFFMNLFIGNMCLLIMSDNLIQMIVGWEGVGLCSYGLIGFFYRDDKKYWVGGPDPTPSFPPSHCGMKAFMTTRIGDTFLLIATFIIYSYAGTFNFMELAQMAPTWVAAMSRTPGLLAVVAVLILGGPIGKSAQFPLHEWLPEAMAGPTSVSALIHAATMVKAGVYFVARILPIFYIAAWAGHYSEAAAFFSTVAWIGAFTAFLAATQAMVSVELKKTLAYSTISQIGYMMLGLGVAGFTTEALSGYVAGLFHLMSHAVFKAALFLSAGAVIHACETKYMTEMGGLRKSMPVTFAAMLIATLSLSGVPPLGGFWSKDAVLAATLEAGQYPLLILAAATAAMTFFYSIRMISMTFLGKRSHHIEELEHEGHHVHEVSSVMWFPYAILASATVVIGLVGPIVEELLHNVFHGSLQSESAGLEALLAGTQVANGIPTNVVAVALSITMLIIGGVPAYLIYIKQDIDQTKVLREHRALGAAHGFIWNRWYLNPTYYRVFVDGTIKLGVAGYRTMETAVLGRLNSLGDKVIAFGRGSYGAFETGVIDRINSAASAAVLYLSRWSSGVVEMRIMDQINYAVAGAATYAYHHIKRIQTGVLSYNMLYVALLFLFLLLIMKIRFGV